MFKKKLLVVRGRDEWINQHLAELLQPLLTPDFLDQQGHLDDVKLVVQLFDLVEVLLLHAPAGAALLAIAAPLGEEQLVDDDAVGVNAVAGKLLDHALGLVQAQELRDADADEGGEGVVLELGVDFGDGRAQRLELLEHLGQVGTVGQPAAGAEEAVKHGTELRGELADLGEGLLQHRGELEEAQRVSRRGGIEDDGLVGERLHLLENFCERHGLVDAGDLGV